MSKNLILVVEDNEDIRENTIEILEMAGYEVITATNGKEGYRQAMDNDPDVILCDILMPEMDGHTLLETLKKNRDMSTTPFIFFSASVEKKEIEKAFSEGVVAYIKKPFEVNELLDTIERYLQ